MYLYVKCTFMSNVPLCEVYLYVKCTIMSNVPLCQMYLYVKCTFMWNEFLWNVFMWSVPVCEMSLCQMILYVKWINVKWFYVKYYWSLFLQLITSRRGIQKNRQQVYLTILVLIKKEIWLKCLGQAKFQTDRHLNILQIDIKLLNSTNGNYSDAWSKKIDQSYAKLHTKIYQFNWW